MRFTDARCVRVVEDDDLRYALCLKTYRSTFSQSILSHPTIFGFTEFVLGIFATTCTFTLFSFAGANARCVHVCGADSRGFASALHILGVTPSLFKLYLFIQVRH